MQYDFSDNLGGRLILTTAEVDFSRKSISAKNDQLLAMMWNRGPDQQVKVDDMVLDFKSDHFLCLMANQRFEFQRPQDITCWQYNRDFYCIIDHDSEVSCAGFLFYGSHGIMFIEPGEEELPKFQLLQKVFVDEYQNQDSIQGEMLRMLLKRLIIKLTRLAKVQHVGESVVNSEYDIIRQFNLAVESNYRELHQVKDYAVILNKSPKTLSNLFAKYSEKSPLQVIKERIGMEGKRLLTYTDKSISEIAFDLGFDEPAHFSRFFKKVVGLSPSAFKISLTA